MRLLPDDEFDLYYATMLRLHKLEEAEIKRRQENP